MSNEPRAGADAEGSPRVDPDRSLVDRFRQGDKRAFDELVLARGDAIAAVVRRYVKNDADTEEITQRAFLAAYEKIESFRGESSFKTWVYRIAVNLALNHIRGGAKVTHVEVDDLAAFTNSLGTERLVAAEVWTKVQARLHQLPPKQRLVVELRLFHDMTFKEVSAIADCSEDSAKVNFHHGVKKLRELLPSAAAYGR